MHRIMVINPKGGSGKSTVAMNLAGFYANWGMPVTLADMDEQRSSLAWINTRTASLPVIRGLSADLERMPAPAETRYLIMDTPAALNGERLERHLAMADTLLIPVQASPVDIRTAARFCHQLLFRSTAAKQLHIGIIANRVRCNTNAYKALKDFLGKTPLSFLGTLRESRNYLHAAETGLSLFDLRTRSARQDMEQWGPIINWLDTLTV